MKKYYGETYSCSDADCVTSPDDLVRLLCLEPCQAPGIKVLKGHPEAPTFVMERNHFKYVVVPIQEIQCYQHHGTHS